MTKDTEFEKLSKVSFLRAKRATLISQKTLGDTFWPLINSFEFLQILGNLQYKKNHQEFKRIFKGQKSITQGFHSMYSTRNDESENFQGTFKHSEYQELCTLMHTTI